MISYEAYYSNPFANDDDELCYAEVDIPDDYESTALPANAQPRPHASAERNRRSGAALSPQGAATPSALQRQLQEAHAVNQQLHGEYEGLIDSLRAELEAANAKNSELMSRVTQLDSQLRAAHTEKDTAEWSVRQEKDRNQVLQKRITAMENELDGDRRTSSYTASQTLLQQPYQPPRSQMLHSGGYGGSFQEEDATPHTRPKANEESADSPFLQPAPQRASGGSSTLVRGRMPLTRQEHQERQRAAPAHQDPAAGLTNKQQGQQQQRRGGGRPKNPASQQELDSMLLYHSRRRDELASELQRLDGARLRGAVERRKRETVEASLDEEERQIGHIRLLLRSQVSTNK